MERRLIFEYDEGPNNEVRYNVWNKDGQFLGFIAKRRLGAYMHWHFFPKSVENVGDLWFSAGCMDEIRECMKNPERYVNGK